MIVGECRRGAIQIFPTIGSIENQCIRERENHPLNFRASRGLDGLSS
jgi:hypothetical protein